MSKINRKTSCKTRISNYSLLRSRELGFKRFLGYGDEISRKIYNNLESPPPNDDVQSKIITEEGGIFNLEFSIDGNLLAAACECKSVLLYDAGNQKLIRKIDQAHSSCVNCVRFLDDNTFATCSDDTTVKIWDTRLLKSPIKTLRGHSNWVKNIEYSVQDRRIVTSAFDGSIYSWDIFNNDTNDLIVIHEPVFVLCGLMRTRLTPDGSKMIICTTSGYIIIIHDLNLSTLCRDIQGFRPNLYRLMQVSDQTFPSATAYNHLFSQNRKANRIEIISDFPSEAEVISSLQVHPMGWSALSRYISGDEDTEWTCVHDIQTRDPKEYEDAYLIVENPALPELEETAPPASQNTLGIQPRDLWMGLLTNEQLRRLRVLRATPTIDAQHEDRVMLMNSGIIQNQNLLNENRNMNMRRAAVAAELSDGTSTTEDANLNSKKIYRNLPRLTHYIVEPSVGKGYIKELCFSGDGRIICSPYKRGVRLLGYNEHMQELSHCVPDEPVELVPFRRMEYHPNYVVSCKFNPRHYQAVSGCLGGTIVWYKPIF